MELFPLQRRVVYPVQGALFLQLARQRPGKEHTEVTSLPGKEHTEVISLPGKEHTEVISLPGQLARQRLGKEHTEVISELFFFSWRTSVSRKRKNSSVKCHA